MAERDEDDADEHDDDADDAPPSSVEHGFHRRDPPTAAELEHIRRTFPVIVKQTSGLVWSKICGQGISPESGRQLYQETYTRYWALVKRRNVPPNPKLTAVSIAWRLVRGYLRDKGRQAKHAGAFRRAVRSAPTSAEPTEHLHVLLDEAGGLLTQEDRQLLHWYGVEGLTYAEIAEMLGVPEGTVCTRMRAAKKRLVAILGLSGKKDPEK